MRVLSLFDGCGCAYQAMKNLNWEVDRYDASEIDTYAGLVTFTNHPTVHFLGDINSVRIDTLGCPDLLIAGSPCQDLSVAKRNRRGLQGEKSGLFYKFLECLDETKPKYFLLENVASMSSLDRDTITHLLGVEPVRINSSLLTAQMRDRLYWCNWDVSQPKNTGQKLTDVLEHGWTERDKSLCLDANYFKGASAKHYLAKSVRQLVFQDKNWYDYHTSNGQKIMPKYLNPKYRSGGTRLLTLTECERLQGLPDGYTEGTISNTQRYKMLGNSFTVPVISHILSESGIQ